MKVSEPLVSVVLPVYNRPTVVSTIKSVLEQTYSNFEFLIIDNASTDSTVECIRQFSDPRIRLLINEENRGQTYSINRGLSEAKGKYIAHIDADDLMVPERLEKQVQFMEMHPDFGLVGSWVRFIDFNDRLSITVQMPTTARGMQFMQTISCGMYHPTAMLRKEVLDQFHLRYDPDIFYAQDYDMWREVMKYSKALNLPEVLVYYRKGDNDSKKHADLMHREIYEIRQKVLDDEFKLDSKTKKKIEEIIDLELQKEKSIKDTIKIWNFYQHYLHRYIDKSSEDYKILQTHIKLKVYSACINDNHTIWSSALDRLYHGLTRIRTAIGF